MEQALRFVGLKISADELDYMLSAVKHVKLSPPAWCLCPTFLPSFLGVP